MKSKYLILVFCLLLGSVFAFNQFRNAKAAKTAPMVKPSTTQSFPASEENNKLDDVQFVIDTSNELTTKWLNTIGAGNWLYVSSRYETTQELSTDPETGLPIPQKALWESWFALDEAGRQTAVLTRRTDLENSDNVVYVAWQNGILYRLPGGTREDTNQQGNIWQTFRPLRDHACNTRLQDFLVSSNEDGISREVSSEWITNANGINQWVVKMTIQHPAVSDVSGFPGRFVGQEFICYRNSETGAIESTEEFLITNKGEHILLGRDYDYEVLWVGEPPVEMIDILKQSTVETEP